MQRTLPTLFLLLVLSLIPSAAAAQLGQSTQGDEPSFHLVTDQEGWLLVNQHLFWSRTGGDSWQEITPSLSVAGSSAPALIRAVFFLDARNGWVLSSRANDIGSEDYALARTLDGGRTWQNQSLALFDLGANRPVARAASLYFVDSETGWLVLRQASGSNFVVGTLFQTKDGGRSWTPLSIPIAEPVYFVNRTIGWTAGGPAGDQFYRTLDGGQTWHASKPGGSAAPNQATRFYQLPYFRNEREGVAIAFVADGTQTQVEVYQSHDGGASWDLERQLAVSQTVSSAADLPVAFFDVDDWLLLAPQQQALVSKTRGAAVETSKSSDRLTANLRRLDMRSRQVGWAWYSTGDCTFAVGVSSARPKANQTCTQDRRLLRTKDGGKTWQAGNLPQVVANEFGARERTTMQTLTGQGFDKCEIATLEQLQTWWSSSPYDAVNLYIGGLNRHCANSALNATYVAQIYNQGWRFIPTWVGRQAPCNGSAYPYKFSLDPATAYNEGVSEADEAVNVAAGLGLGAGSVIYTDIEWYNATNTACKSAVNSFVSGWSGRLRARGYVAGAYGATCAGVTDWANIANVPDALWGAWWNYTSYNSGASVWNLPCLSNSLWSNHQRIHQYAGGHNETWGGVTLNIDSDAADGIVAGYGGSPPIAPNSPNPSDDTLLPRTSRSTLYWSTNGTSCDVRIWGGEFGVQGIEGANLPCGSAFVGARRGGSYRWQITARNNYGATLGPTWRFDIQPASPTNLRATSAGATRLDLLWTKSSDDPGAVDNYKVYRNGSLYLTLPAGTTSTTADIVSCPTLMAFYVTAVREGVESTPSNTTWSCLNNHLYLPVTSH